MAKKKDEESYSKFHRAFFTGSTGRKIKKDKDTMLLAVFLITNPYIHMSGIYQLPHGNVMAHLPMTLDEIICAYNKLKEIGFCLYDDETEYVWVIQMGSFQIGRELKQGDNRIINIITHLTKSVDKETFFYNQYISHYKDAFHLSKLLPESEKQSVDNFELEAPSEAPSQEGDQGGREASNSNSNNNNNNKDMFSTDVDNKAVDKSTPACPHKKIVELWNETMPDEFYMNYDLEWNDVEKKNLRKRWAEDESRQNLEWWKNMFETKIIPDDWKMGRDPKNNGWLVDLAWIVRPKNWSGVLAARKLTKPSTNTTGNTATSSNSSQYARGKIYV